MRRALLTLIGLAASGAVGAQTPASEPKAAQPQAAEPKAAEPKAPEQAAKPKAPLKLRLDDATSAAPRVTFGPRESEPQKAGDGLPALGGDRSRALEESMRRSTPPPYPPDKNPGH